MPTTTTPYDDLTREQLYHRAQERDLPGRSQMSRDALVAALELDDRGPDALALLERQHDEFRRLFADFRDLGDRPSQRKAELVREIVTQLVRHAEVEEQIFYPAVRNELPDLADDVDEDLEEHHVAELLLWELDHVSPQADRYDAKVAVLIENVEHHLEEEEGELFPAVRQRLDEERRRELGAALRAAWPTVPTRPHPLSPDTPPGNVLTALPARVQDLGVGALRAARERLRQRRGG